MVSASPASSRRGNSVRELHSFLEDCRGLGQHQVSWLGSVTLSHVAHPWPFPHLHAMHKTWVVGLGICQVELLSP